MTTINTTAPQSPAVRLAYLLRPYTVRTREQAAAVVAASAARDARRVVKVATVDLREPVAV
jgi:hypothetical protein